jgi:hypothetical protein
MAATKRQPKKSESEFSRAKRRTAPPTVPVAEDACAALISDA